MTKPKDGGAAFPFQEHTHGNVEPEYGMTLRDWFASQALQAIIGGRSWNNLDGCDLIKQWAKSSYAIADAMLAEREKAGK